jgi:hypothetical protein
MDTLADNKRALDDFLKETLLKEKAPNWSYTGHYLILGGKSVVHCVHHEIVANADGSILQTWHLQTTRQHAF